MAEEQDESDKSEDPTLKKLDDALKRGDVAKSQEVPTWFVLSGATLALVAFSGAAGQGLKTSLAGLIANAWRIPTDGAALTRLAARIGFETVGAPPSAGMSCSTASCGRRRGSSRSSTAFHRSPA
jgi:flagellar biosynthetic protein FlhB